MNGYDECFVPCPACGGSGCEVGAYCTRLKPTNCADCTEAQGPTRDCKNEPIEQCAMCRGTLTVPASEAAEYLEPDYE